MINIIYSGSAPDPDSMPAAFTTFYKTDPNHINVLSQIRASFLSEQGLWLDFTDFQREPYYDETVENSSCCAFSISGRDLITVIALSHGNIRLYKNSKYLSDIVPLQRYSGEDEQGWYNGVRFIIGNDILKNADIIISDSPGNSILSAFFTFQNSGKMARFGSTSPIFSESPFDLRNLSSTMMIKL